MADCLEVEDATASDWFAQQTEGRRADSPSSGDLNPDMGGRSFRPCLRTNPGRMHLLLGCSIARDAGLEVTDADDMILNLARGGNTWKKLSASLNNDFQRWRQAATAFGIELGHIIIWMSGNEAYDKRTGCDRLIAKPRGPLESLIQEVLKAVREVAKPVVLGPLPRFWTDRLLPWEHTAAYRLDRKVKEATVPGEFHSLGKSLTKKTTASPCPRRGVPCMVSQRWDPSFQGRVS